LRHLLEFSPLIFDQRQRLGTKGHTSKTPAQC